LRNSAFQYLRSYLFSRCQVASRSGWTAAGALSRASKSVRNAHYDRRMASAPRHTDHACPAVGDDPDFVTRSLDPTDSRNPRSDPRRRRGWLRDLDSTLGSELEEAGALSRAELVEFVKQPLRGRASPATIDEWWEYAYRRSWIEEHGDRRCRLTTSGLSGLHARRQRDAGIDQAGLGRAILKWVLPASTVGATAYLAGRFPASTASILLVAVGVAVGLILLAPLMRRFDQIMTRQEARRACDWLDDRYVWRIRGGARPTGPAERLYGDNDRSAPGLLDCQPHAKGQ
jgi:hypothetical protein